MAEDGALYPRPALRRGVQSRQPKKPQVCPDGRPDWGCKESEEHSLHRGVALIEILIDNYVNVFLALLKMKIFSVIW